MSRLDETRRRRLAEIWRADAPSEFEVSMALQRFEARRRSGLRLGPATLGWAVFGAVCGFLVMALLPGPRASSLGIAAEPPAEPALAPAATQQRVEAPPPSRIEPPPVERARPVPHSVKPRSVTPPAEPAPEPVAESDVRRDRDDLARAERWLAVGRGKDAAPILAGLEEHGATDSIRRRARQLASERR